MIEDADLRKIAFVTFDAVGMDGGLVALALESTNGSIF